MSTPRSRWRLRLCTALALGAVLVAGCGTQTSAPMQAEQAAATLATDRFVVAISVDGFNPNALDQLGPARAPHLHRMIAEGASTLNARTAYEVTKTLPNHTGMLTGRRVTTTTGHHVDFNTDHGTTVHREAGAYRMSLFDVVHDRGGSTVLYASKSKFAMYDRSWNGTNGAADQVGVNNGRDKIDRYVFDSCFRLTSRLVDRLKSTPADATFLHLSLPDDAGHAHGFMGPAYLDAVERVDRQVGRILTAVRDSAYLRDRVDVLLTADHGGDGASHGSASDRDNYTIPFIAWGVDVASGATLYALNPERTNPGTGRPGYESGAPPIRNTDIANLVTTLLGLPEVPGASLPGTTPLEVS